jgi:hypothetical protein
MKLLVSAFKFYLPIRSLETETIAELTAAGGKPITFNPLAFDLINGKSPNSVKNSTYAGILLLLQIFDVANVTFTLPTLYMHQQAFYYYSDSQFLLKLTLKSPRFYSAVVQHSHQMEWAGTN